LIAKFYIIRILIDELSNKEQDDQIKNLFESDVGSTQLIFNWFVDIANGKHKKSTCRVIF